METDKTRHQVAEPAEEEIKKHGDPMRSQVADAARKTAHDAAEKTDGKDNKPPESER